VALSITAFPMLARIIIERGLVATPSGTLALAAGGTDDVVAWVLLAGVLSVASGAAGPILIAVGGAAVFAVVLILVLRPILHRALADLDRPRENGLLTTVLVLFAAAWFTDVIHLYVVFGAFCVGMVAPRTQAAQHVVYLFDSVSRAVFLPMFFTYSGLNTRFTVLGDPAVLTFGVAAVLLAVLGKFGGCMLAARLSGQTPIEAARIGALMNARGLMQLIALNIALDAGIINTTMFSALILVATVTTMMATPTLAWLDVWERRKDSPDPGPDPVPVPDPSPVPDPGAATEVPAPDQPAAELAGIGRAPGREEER
jgi:Kef-type K+ transport system membrane component KefB